MQVAAIILAGGQARRMQSHDKPLMLLGDKPLIAHVITRLGMAGAISANGDPARFAAFGLPVLPDPVPGFLGPLAGVLAGMDWAAGQGFTHILTAAADTPFFPRDLASRLIAKAGKAPVIMARGMTPDGLRDHPVFALWQVSLRDRLRDLLTGGGGAAVGRWAREQGAIAVTFPGSDPFFNINTPQDLAKAEAMLADSSGPGKSTPQ